MVKVLAFDTGSLTGVAFGRSGEIPAARSIALTGNWPSKYAQIMRSVRALIEEHEPDIVAVEEAMPGANHDLTGLIPCVKGEAFRRGCRVEAYYPATVRKGFMGSVRPVKIKGKSDIKQQVFNHCLALGWSPANTDESDSMALWSYVCSLHDRGHQITALGGLFGKVVR